MISVIDNNIAVSPLDYPDLSPGGIIIPDQAKARCTQGIIKHIGPNVPEGIFEIGDTVLFSGYTGTLIHVEGEGRLVIFRYDFAVAKLYPPNTKVPGLYYKVKSDIGMTVLEKILNDYLNADSITADHLLSAGWNTQEIVQYLYENGVLKYDYETADFETVIQLAAESQAEYTRRIESGPKKGPKITDEDKRYSRGE